MKYNILEEDDKNHIVIYLLFTDLCASAKSVYAQEIFEVTSLTRTLEELTRKASIEAVIRRNAICLING